MGSFHDALARTHTAVARVHGTEVQRTPAAGGAAVALTLLPDSAAQVETDMMGVPIRTERTFWRALAPAVLALGDTIAFPAGHPQAGNWRVDDHPRRGGEGDPNGLWLHFALRPA